AARVARRQPRWGEGPVSGARLVGVRRNALRTGKGIRSVVRFPHGSLDVAARYANRHAGASAAALHGDANVGIAGRGGNGRGERLRWVHGKAVTTNFFRDAARRAKGVIPIAAPAPQPLTFSSL